MKNEIDKSILERNNITIKKGFNKKAVALIMLAAAITVAATLMGDTSEAKMPILLLGITLLITGITWMTKRETTLIYRPTGETMEEKILFLEGNMGDITAELLKKGDIDGVVERSREDGNGTIKVEICMAPSESIAIYRIYKYVPYMFEPITEYQVLKK